MRKTKDKKIEKITKKEIEKHLSQYVDVKNQLKDLKKKEEEFKERILFSVDEKEFLRDENTKSSDVFVRGGFEIVRTERVTEAKVDYEAFFRENYDPATHENLTMTEEKKALSFKIQEAK